MVERIVKRLITNNNFERQCNPDRIKVKVLFDDTVFLYLSHDLTLFVTHRALTVSEKDERLLSILISHELAHYLLSHQSKRLLTAFLNTYIQGIIFDEKKIRKTHKDIDVYDPMITEYEKRTALQKYSGYYPAKQKILDKFYERNCDALAVQLWTTAYGPLKDENSEGSEEKEGQEQDKLRMTTEQMLLCCDKLFNDNWNKYVIRVEPPQSDTKTPQNFNYPRLQVLKTLILNTSGKDE